MRVLSPDEVFGSPGSEPPFERVARHSTLGPLLVALVFSALEVLVAAAAFLLAAPYGPGALLLAAACALPFLALLTLVNVTLLGAVRATLLPRSNWWVATAPDGLWLNLRSYGNYHFGGADPTLVFLSWPELAAAGQVTEWTREIDSDGDEVRRSTRRLELVLSVDDHGLAEALAAERVRPAPTRTFLGIRSTKRSSHWPVLLAEPGRVRVEWPGRRFLAALPPTVERLAPRRVGYGVEGASDEPEDVLRDLVERGQEGAARRLLRRRTGCSLREARDAVERIAGREERGLRPTGT